MLTLTARNSSTGSILPDLTPYLAAGMHVFAVAADMQWSAHLHGMLPGAAMNMGCGYHAMTMPPATFASPVSFTVVAPLAHSEPWAHSRPLPATPEETREETFLHWLLRWAQSVRCVKQRVKLKARIRVIPLCFIRVGITIHCRLGLRGPQP
jgi:hypothetical protein